MAKHSTDSSASDTNAGGDTKKTRSLSKPGFHRQAIQIPDAAWAKIVAHVDANDLDLDKWLTGRMSEIADKLA
jgi:hypothetical protein